MSKVKIQGNASGTGTLTISAPNTNTDRSLTLPDGAGEILLANGDGSSLTGISSSATPSFCAIRSVSDGNQVLSDATTTKVIFPTEVFDSDGEFASSRWTCGTSGKYYIGANITLQGGESRWRNGAIYLYKNGIRVFDLGKMNSLGSYLDTVSLTGHSIFDVTSGDYFEIYAYLDVTTTSTGFPNVNVGSYIKTSFYGFRIE